ncbi:ABC transporter permease [Nocardioides hungaricus]
MPAPTVAPTTSTAPASTTRQVVSWPRAIREDLLGSVRLTQAALVIVALVAWEIAGRQLGNFYLPPPTVVAGAAKEVVSTGELQQAILESLLTLGIGYALSVVVGVALGYAMGWYRSVGKVMDPFVNGLYVIPVTALVPLIIIWFGLGMLPRVLTIFLFAVFQVLVTTYTGVRHRDQVLVEVASSFGATQLPLFQRVVFHDSLPHIFTGLRLGASQAIKGMVIAEFLFAATGIGGAVIAAADRYQTAKVFVYIIVIVILGMVLSGLVQLLEKLLVKGRA